MSKPKEFTRTFQNWQVDEKRKKIYSKQDGAALQKLMLEQ